MTHDPTAVITIDPARNFGRPSVNHGPATAVVAGTVWAGDPVATVADEYGITRAAVLVACWYETYEHRHWPAWADRGAWAMAAEPHLQDGTYDLIPDPPSKEDTR